MPSDGLACSDPPAGFRALFDRALKMEEAVTGVNPVTSDVSAPPHAGRLSPSFDISSELLRNLPLMCGDSNAKAVTE